MFALFSGGGKAALAAKEYRARARSLLFNLKDALNPDLRARLLLREVPPERLVRMTPEELASKEKKAWRAQTEISSLKARAGRLRCPPFLLSQANRSDYALSVQPRFAFR